MDEQLLNVLNSETKENTKLFDKIRAEIFKDYAGNNKKMNKRQAKKALIELMELMYAEELDNESFEVLFSDLDSNNKGYLNKRDFTGMTKCFIISLIKIANENSNIKIDFFNENGISDSFIIGGGGDDGED